MSVSHPPGSSAGAHILVVDDDPQITAILLRYLQGNGYRGSAAHDAAAMRSAIASDSVDLILLDLGLPDEDGLELLRELRRSGKRPSSNWPASKT